MIAMVAGGSAKEWNHVIHNLSECECSSRLSVVEKLQVKSNIKLMVGLLE